MKRVIVIVIIVVLLVASVIVGFILYENYEFTTCGIDCGPIDTPVLLKATLNQSSDTGSPENCAAVNNGYPQSVVCQVVTTPGSSGSIIVRLDSQNGKSLVAFGEYSSNQYVQFDSNYSCLYSSNLPDYNTLHCPVLVLGSTYQFNFSVSQNSPQNEEVVLTIVVTQTCCFP